VRLLVLFTRNVASSFPSFLKAIFTIASLMSELQHHNSQIVGENFELRERKGRDDLVIMVRTK
jgi:hypothetical protein